LDFWMMKKTPLALRYPQAGSGVLAKGIGQSND
jgi:hypothetical protein